MSLLGTFKLGFSGFDVGVVAVDLELLGFGFRFVGFILIWDLLVWTSDFTRDLLFTTDLLVFV